EVRFFEALTGFSLLLRYKIPYPQSLFCRQNLGNEKKILWRTSLSEKGDGDQVSFLATPTFLKQRFGCYLRDLDL
ncbi:hypothetical protein ACFOY3_02890, partial [Kaistella carnis]|uniref:hypothetical protein n=1 Tax=Kaistella carnis TaxID=1241979 RepID=UPI00362388D6